MRETRFFRIIKDLKIKLDESVFFDIFKTDLDIFIAVQIFLEIGKISKDFKYDVNCGLRLQDFIDAGIRTSNEYINLGERFTMGGMIENQLELEKFIIVLKHFKDSGI